MNSITLPPPNKGMELTARKTRRGSCPGHWAEKMTDPEVLWNHEKRHDFARDLRSFCESLDRYQIAFNASNEGGKRVYLREQGYELDYRVRDGAFACPECHRTEFDVVEGDLGGNAVLGLACVSCGTYGVVFPHGL